MDFKLDEFEDDGDDSSWDGPVSGRNCIVFLIDASKSMFDIHEGQETPYFKQSIECCKNALLHICRKETNDLTAVMLYGTDKRHGKYAKENTVLLQPLGEPTVQKIKELSDIINDGGEQIEINYGHSDKYKLYDVLHYCQMVISHSGAKVYTKNLVIFTNQDHPHNRTPEFEFRARKQAEEYYRHEIDIEVVGFGDFDSSKFYKELILTSRGELLKDWEKKDPVKNSKDITNEIERLTDKFTRRLSFLNMGDSEDARYKLQIALYKLYSEPKKFRKFKTHEFDETQNMELDNVGEKNVPESEEMRNACGEVAVEINNKNGFRTEKVAVIGGKEIEIKKSVLTKMLAVKPRGFEIIGFKKTQDIPLYYSVSEPYFIEPFGKDENNQNVFAHLLRRCLEKGLSILCWFSLTVSSRPLLCALHPTDSNKYAKNREHPPGFIASRLPFSEMLLEPDEIEDNGQPTETQTNAALEIVKKTTIPYTVDMFSDYERQKRIVMIESLAFEYEDIPGIDDDTDIDLEDMSNMLGNLNVDFMGSPYIEEVKTNKRTGDFTSSGKPKLQKLDSPLSMVKNGFANKLTVAQLRDLLKAEGIKSVSAMNKPTLVKIANQRFAM